MGKYRTIVADPPWDYGRDTERSPSFTHNGQGPRIERSYGYSTMDTAAIAALPVTHLAEDDARLFLWTTSRHMPEGFDVLEAWGFEYRQTLVWRKTGNPTPFGGSVAPNHAEFILVGIRGNPKVLDRLRASVIDAPAVVRGHSRKPEAFLDYFEQVSPGPYVEMFSRATSPRFGWDYWGDESLGTAEMGSYPMLELAEDEGWPDSGAGL